MSSLFAILFIISFVCLIISFFRADLFYGLLKIKEKKKIIILWFLLTIFLFFLLIFFSEKPRENKNAELENKISSLEKQLEIEKAKNNEIVQENKEETTKTLKVVNVIDGDTVKLENGQIVRYIGIDTPEVSASGQSDCFGNEASKKNEDLVEGKIVTLVKDVSEVDKYGRILRYVYVGDTFVNDYLVRNGFARATNYPPDEKYKTQFKEAEEEAKNNKRGLWADNVCKIEKISEPVITAPVEIESPAIVSDETYTCNCSKTCAQMSSCAEAQYQLSICGCSKRDADKDGIACDADCQ